MGSPTIVRHKYGGLLLRKWENRSHEGNLGSPRVVPTEYHTLKTKIQQVLKAPKERKVQQTLTPQEEKTIVDPP